MGYEVIYIFPYLWHPNPFQCHCLPGHTHSICKNCSYPPLQGIASCVCMKISITQFLISLPLLKKSLLHDSHILIFIYFFLNLNQQTKFSWQGFSIFLWGFQQKLLDNIRNKTQSCVQNTVTDSCFVCISISTDHSLLKGFNRAHIIFYELFLFYQHGMWQFKTSPISLSLSHHHICLCHPHYSTGTRLMRRILLSSRKATLLM